jgi:hypothetical protein
MYCAALPLDSRALYTDDVLDVPRSHKRHMRKEPQLAELGFRLRPISREAFRIGHFH